RDDDVQVLPHSLRHNRDELQGDLLEHAAAVEYSQEHCGRDDYARHGERVRCVAVEYPGLCILVLAVDEHGHGGGDEECWGRRQQACQQHDQHREDQHDVCHRHCPAAAEGQADLRLLLALILRELGGHLFDVDESGACGVFAGTDLLRAAAASPTQLEYTEDRGHCEHAEQRDALGRQEVDPD